MMVVQCLLLLIMDKGVVVRDRWTTLIKHVLRSHI